MGSPTMDSQRERDFANLLEYSPLPAITPPPPLEVGCPSGEDLEVDYVFCNGLLDNVGLGNGIALYIAPSESKPSSPHLALAGNILWTGIVGWDGQEDGVSNPSAVHTDTGRATDTPLVEYDEIVTGGGVLVNSSEALEPVTATLSDEAVVHFQEFPEKCWNQKQQHHYMEQPNAYGGMNVYRRQPLNSSQPDETGLGHTLINDTNETIPNAHSANLNQNLPSSSILPKSAAASAQKNQQINPTDPRYYADPPSFNRNVMPYPLPTATHQFSQPQNDLQQFTVQFQHFPQFQRAMQLPMQVPIQNPTHYQGQTYVGGHTSHTPMPPTVRNASPMEHPYNVVGGFQMTNAQTAALVAHDRPINPLPRRLYQGQPMLHAQTRAPHSHARASGTLQGQTTWGHQASQPHHVHQNMIPQHQYQQVYGQGPSGHYVQDIDDPMQGLPQASIAAGPSHFPMASNY